MTSLHAPVADLVYTGAVVEGVRVTGVIHETSNITGSVGCLQELHLHIHLVELQGGGELRYWSGQRLRVGIRFRMGATYNKVLLLVTDLDSVYGIRGEGTAGIFFILYVAHRKKNLSLLDSCDFIII